jgi:GxxExxY protein
MTTKLIYAELSEAVIGAFYRVYNALGFGFLEAVYANAISLDLRTRGFLVEREVPTAVYYMGQPIGKSRIDMLIEKKLVVEIKASTYQRVISTKKLHQSVLVPPNPFNPH